LPLADARHDLGVPGAEARERFGPEPLKRRSLRPGLGGIVSAAITRLDRIGNLLRGLDSERRLGRRGLRTTGRLRPPLG
jgi:hypothetical protein